MDKNGVLTISDFQAGVADSPLLGFARMNNVDIFEKPGIVKMQFGSTLSFSTASLPTCMAFDSLGNQFVGCYGGEIYKNGAILTTTSSLLSGKHITDIEIITDGTLDPNNVPIEYLFIVCSDPTFAFYGPTYSTGAIGQAVTGGTLATCHKQIAIGIDLDNTNKPIIYFGNGNTIASIKNFTHVAVGSAPTYTVNYSALTLQPGHYAYSLSNLGKYLSIGTVGSNSNIYAPITTKNSALILWDRTSTTFNLPTFFKENGITAQLQMQNLLYLAIGNRGRIFYTDGTNFKQIKRIPYTFDRQFGNYAFIYPNALTLHNGNIVIGISGSGTNGNYGVYEMALTPATVGNSIVEYPTIMRNSPSSGGSGESQTLNIGVLHSNNADQLYIGWQDGTSYGVDVVSSALATNFSTTIFSKYYTVGSELRKKTFKRMELSLTAPLITGQQIRVSYRENLNDTNWTTIGTYTVTNFGTNNVYNCSANLASKTKLQFKIELTQPTSTAFGNNIELESLTFYPSEK